MLYWTLCTTWEFCRKQQILKKRKKKKASGDERRNNQNIKAFFAYLNVKVFIKGTVFQKLSHTIFRRDKHCETT